MDCTRCGAKNPEQAKYCYKCGSPVAAPKKHANLLWPKVDTIASAISAAKQGAAACFLVAAITGIIALIAIANQREILGANGWSLLDASLFAIAGWRTLRLSRAWSITAMALYLAEAGFKLYQGAFGGIVLMMVLITALVNGIRGAFAYHSLCARRLKQPGTVPAQVA